jgi:hypothetical protein
MIKPLTILTTICLASTTQASELATNLANPTGGVEIATGINRLTAAFATDGTSHTLSSVKLLVAGTGTPQLTLHADGGLEPGPALGTLTLTGALPVSLGVAEFQASGITLNPNSKYWIVLKGVTGTIDWGWTTTSAGTGVGYSKEWGRSSDDGAFWWTQDRYPLQMAVIVDQVCAADCDGSGSLNINDFICFQTNFALSDPAADCDANGALNIDDFICYQTVFALGC